jgi:hypothetical protein
MVRTGSDAPAFDRDHSPVLMTENELSSAQLFKLWNEALANRIENAHFSNAKARKLRV